MRRRLRGSSRCDAGAGVCESGTRAPVQQPFRAEGVREQAFASRASSARCSNRFGQCEGWWHRAGICESSHRFSPGLDGAVSTTQAAQARTVAAGPMVWVIEQERKWAANGCLGCRGNSWREHFSQRGVRQAAMHRADHFAIAFGVCRRQGNAGPYAQMPGCIRAVGICRARRPRHRCAARNATVPRHIARAGRPTHTQEVSGAVSTRAWLPARAMPELRRRERRAQPEPRLAAGGARAGQ